jgi:hypothetical protein
MGLQNFNTEHELFFHHEFINDETFPEQKKGILEKDGGTYFIKDDFTIYQQKHHPLLVINRNDFMDNRGSFGRILYHLKINKVEDFIQFHFDKYKGDKKGFVDYVYHEFNSSKLTQGNTVLPDRQQKIIMLEWLTKKKNMLLQKQLQEKNEFLKKAYEAAHEFAPESPLSVSIIPRELGKSIGYDEATTSRIMNELVGDGYASSGLGMHILFVTKDGLNYLHQLETKTKENSSMNFSVGNNSNVNFINHSPGATINNNSEVINKVKNIIETIQNDNSIDKSTKEEAIGTFNKLITTVEKGQSTKDTVSEILTVGANISSIGSLVISLIQLFK